jgi:hypothetical protein
LTSHVCKVLEALIKDVLVQHLQIWNLNNDSQHGFVKVKSFLTNLLSFFDSGDPVDVIYLDFQKAFDKVPHRRLLKKVKAMGIGGKLYKWIADWLSDRKQRVCLAGPSSDYPKVVCWTQCFF